MGCTADLVLSWLDSVLPERVSDRTVFLVLMTKSFAENSTRFAQIITTHSRPNPPQLYEDDARIGHQAFDLKLTSRVKMCMVGVPEASFSFWASKFLAKGYKVGKVEQCETALGAEMRVAKGGDAKKEKLVRRVLNKVFTNGTLVDGEFLTDEEAGHCISIRVCAVSSDREKEC